MEPSQQVNPKKLFVGNLSYTTDEAMLRDAFAAFGEVIDVKIVTDYGTGRSKGFAFVEFSEEPMAQAAIEGLNEKEVDGRTIFVKVAQPKQPRTDRGGDRGGDRRFSNDRRPSRGGSSFGGGRSGGGNRDDRSY